jgi:hypothetical protein
VNGCKDQSFSTSHLEFCYVRYLTEGSRSDKQPCPLLVSCFSSPITIITFPENYDY